MAGVRINNIRVKIMCSDRVRVRVTVKIRVRVKG